MKYQFNTFNNTRKMKYDLVNDTEIIIPNSKIQIKLLAKYFILLFLIIWFQLLGNIASIITFICLIIYSMTNAKSAIKSLMIGFVIGFLNPGIFPKSQYINILKWVLLFTSAFRIYLDWLKIIIFSNNDRIPKWFISLIVFVIFTIMSSYLMSYNFTISFMKIFSFFIAVSSILIGFNLTRNYNWKSWFYSVFFVVLISSLPFIFFKQGYFVNGRGFQGIILHPQSYGIILVIPLIWITNDLISLKNRDFIIYILIALGWFTLYLSQCRTAVFAVIAALLTYFIIKFNTILSKIRSILKYFLKPVSIFAIVLIVIIGLINYRSIYSNTKHFILKGNYFVNSSNVSPIEIYDKARILKVKKSILNFEHSPIFGNGFGVGSEEATFAPQTFSFAGINIPIGASTEKSFLISALLEETGIIGFILFFIFVIIISIPVIHSNNIGLILMLLTAFYTTFGEMTIFSSAGIGLYIWLFIGMAMNSSKKNKDNFISNEA